MVEISEEDRQLFHEGVAYSSPKGEVKEKKEKKSSTAFSIAKVFGYMAVALLITTAVAFGVGALISSIFYSDFHNEGKLLTTYFVILIVSAIALFIDVIVIHFMVARDKHSIMVPGIIYAVLIGVLFSMLTIIIDWRLLGMAFGITALTFVLMGLIAFLSKGNMAPLLIVIMGLVIGIGVLSLVHWIYAIATGTIINGLYLGISIAVFALLMFVTIYDMWRIKEIAEQGAMSKNVALYSAFIIYVDFINIFIRILYFLLIILSKSKK
ncbi:MAG: Bax inhibitor-1 family protein [Bacilli bacterium]|nr:Bax inhibitor-1 family protein [Bacilli bacterium]